MIQNEQLYFLIHFPFKTILSIDFPMSRPIFCQSCLNAKKSRSKPREKSGTATELPHRSNAEA